MTLKDPRVVKFEESLLDCLKQLIKRKEWQADKERTLESLTYEYNNLTKLNNGIHRSRNINIVLFTFLIPYLTIYADKHHLFNDWVSFTLIVLSVPSFFYGMALMVDRDSINEATRMNQIKLLAYAELIDELKELTESENDYATKK